MKRRPNVILIVNDDMGYSDLGCYGGEIDTPNLDRLAANGLRFTNFYNTARCSPSRASLLTGLHPHQTGIGVLTEDDGPAGYPGNLNHNCLTMAEVLKQNGYRTYMSGKWHLAHDVRREKHTWPCQRGFDRFYGTLVGASSYYRPLTLTRDNDNIDGEALPEDFYYTDALTDEAVSFIEAHSDAYGSEVPFFEYVAYTAPHWPLHANEKDIAKYRGRFDAGWDRLRQERLVRMRRIGIIKDNCMLSERDPAMPPWESVRHRDYLLRCMEVYAAQIEAMDRGIGRIVQTLERSGQLEHTILLFLSDNGGCAEVITDQIRETAMAKGIGTALTRSGSPVQFGNDPSVWPGDESSYQSYGVGWANLSNTPFRMYKHWIHEGGIATPLIVHWPAGISAGGELRHTPCQLTDVLPTVLELTESSYPEDVPHRCPLPLEGRDLSPVLECDDALDPVPLYWEHEGNAGIREAEWKLVRNFPGDWELYNLNEDRAELRDCLAEHPDIVARLSERYEAWASRCGVIPRERIVAAKQRTRKGANING
ncbi:arylsulfatase [Paenibacillus sp. 1P07SE]|uniref:arylsulfatase n=1 Tax=Paenibacillus sp. 1P07SE TaxID=3132209 RepID=UPI0039A6D257